MVLADPLSTKWSPLFAGLIPGVYAGKLHPASPGSVQANQLNSMALVFTRYIELLKSDKLSLEIRFERLYSILNHIQIAAAGWPIHRAIDISPKHLSGWVLENIRS
jgi:hypothetical protein